jgi:serine/threonine protein phosphatase 1
MKKKIFAISDIHGYYTETLHALKNARWDEQNPEHLLLVLGDIFDRGPSSYDIYLWLSRLVKEKKAIVLKGNHELMFIEWLSGPVSPHDWKYNGLSETTESFYGSFWDWFDKNTLPGAPETVWYDWSEMARGHINRKHPELLEWLRNLPDYFETEHSIFTHGSIQTYGDWKNPELKWKTHHWDDGGFFEQNIISTDKVVVVGHFGTNEIRSRNLLSLKEDHSILIREDLQIIMIDGCVPVTKKVNVLVIEDNLLGEY